MLIVLFEISISIYNGKSTKINYFINLEQIMCSRCSLVFLQTTKFSRNGILFLSFKGWYSLKFNDKFNNTSVLRSMSVKLKVQLACFCVAEKNGMNKSFIIFFICWAYWIERKDF